MHGRCYYVIAWRDTSEQLKEMIRNIDRIFGDSFLLYSDNKIFKRIPRPRVLLKVCE